MNNQVVGGSSDWGFLRKAGIYLVLGGLLALLLPHVGLQLRGLRFLGSLVPLIGVVAAAIGAILLAVSLRKQIAAAVSVPLVVGLLATVGYLFYPGTERPQPQTPKAWTADPLANNPDNLAPGEYLKQRMALLNRHQDAIRINSAIWDGGELTVDYTVDTDFREEGMTTVFCEIGENAAEIPLEEFDGEGDGQLVVKLRRQHTKEEREQRSVSLRAGDRRSQLAISQSVPIQTELAEEHMTILEALEGRLAVLVIEGVDFKQVPHDKWRAAWAELVDDEKFRIESSSSRTTFSSYLGPIDDFQAFGRKIVKRTKVLDFEPGYSQPRSGLRGEVVIPRYTLTPAAIEDSMGEN